MAAEIYRRGLCAAGLLAMCAAPALARDLDRTDHNSPEVQAWVKSLANTSGVACCATADGWRPREVEWDTTTHGYRVLIENHWVDVPDNAVIHGPNKLGHAEVWYYHVDGLPAVRCFLPGEGM
ncbi:MAG TPA: hypothetical protein VKZ79_14875 [Alphaproteobacteria bacterium]|nr:hypothetical protein [Alphaproteobacteria bacterium]